MHTEEIVALARQRGVIRAADVEELGASRTLLPYLARHGQLRRVARGAYAVADYIAANEEFVAAAATVPSGVICLLSALQFHELTTQLPTVTWMAIQRGRAEPVTGGTSVRIVKFGGRAFTEGIEESVVDGVTIRVYSPAKTVADCFKFRNRIGLDVAREALVDTLTQKKATRDEIWHCAQCCRMSRVIRPYLEMVS